MSKFLVDISESILQLKNSFGSPVGYSLVKEMRSDGTYDIYRYSNLSDTPIDICNRSTLRCSDVTPYDSFSEKNFYRGLLLSKRTYDKTNRLCAVDSLTYRRLSDEDETYYSVFNLNVGWISWYRWISSLPRLFKSDKFIEGMMVKRFQCLCAKNLIYFPKYDVVKIQKETYYPIGSFVSEIEYDKRDLDINEGEATVRKCFSETTKLISNGTPKETHVIKSGYESFLSDFYFPLSTTQEIINGEITNTHKFYYKCLAGNHYVPSSETVSCGTPTTNEGNDGNTVITYNTYDEMGNLLKYTKTGCFQTTLTWNKYGKLIQRTQGNMTQTYTYDSVGQLESITEPNGNRTSFVYDYLGRLIQKSDKTGILQKIHYHYMK